MGRRMIPTAAWPIDIRCEPALSSSQSRDPAASRPQQEGRLTPPAPRQRIAALSLCLWHKSAFRWTNQSNVSNALCLPVKSAASIDGIRLCEAFQPSEAPRSIKKYRINLGSRALAVVALLLAASTTPARMQRGERPVLPERLGSTPSRSIDRSIVLVDVARLLPECRLSACLCRSLATPQRPGRTDSPSPFTHKQPSGGYRRVDLIRPSTCWRRATHHRDGRRPSSTLVVPYPYSGRRREEKGWPEPPRGRRRGQPRRGEEGAAPTLGEQRRFGSGRRCGEPPWMD